MNLRLTAIRFLRALAARLDPRGGPLEQSAGRPSTGAALAPRPGKARPQRASTPLETAMIMSAFPPIAIWEHLTAKERLNPDNWPFVMIDFGHGPSKMYTGTVNLEDYKRRDGYPIRMSGFDRFGWPVGDPHSPETLYAE